MPTKIESKESLFLNILRGLAIFAVIAMHSAQAVESISVQHESSYVREILYLGRYGVEVFFFLSGWLLAALYGFQGDLKSKGFFSETSCENISALGNFLNYLLSTGVVLSIRRILPVRKFEF